MDTFVKHSALYDAHTAHHAIFADRGGWAVASRYGEVEAEESRVRASVGVIDLSEAAKFEVSGRDLATWASQRFGAEPVAPLRAWRSDGAVSVSGLWCRLREDRGIFIASGESSAIEMRLQPSEHETAHLTDITSVYTLLRIAGPETIPLLRKFTSLDMRSSRFSNLSCAQATIAKVRSLIVREDVADLPACWVMCTRDYAEFVWESLLHAGASPFGCEVMEKIGIKD
ncbi:MAG: aminomethyltransferase family protein [candidate division Zixibacteria bacterium]|nr:aminomethyltransferase family protein [candidate division Zixibacteria bacterium]